MKLWKSPVLYFGILLVVAVAALLAAPYVIDWNSYRDQLEAQGEKFTGRDVAINGNISARLFPWPRLTVEDVSIANPPGVSQPKFLTADRIVTSIELAGLFQGNIAVESIDIEHPVIDLERQASGSGNWTLTPDKALLASDVFKRIKLDRISVRNGAVRVTDHRRGEVHRFDSVNASISAPQFAGPWQVRALALYEGHAVDIGFNTGIWKAGEPMRFSIRAASADGSGLVYSFDGAQRDDKAEGEFRIEPGTTANGKADSEGQVRPLMFKAKATATFDEVVLNDIEVAPRDIAEGGTLVSGEAKLRLGKHITAAADLKATTLNLDDLAGAEARTILREQGILPLAGSLLATMPDDLSISGTLQVTALTAGGENLDNAALAIDADRNAIRVKELTATLPGRSRILYEGVFFPGMSGAEAAGSLAVETADLRRLVQWLWPASKPTLDQLWTGSRGQFKMQTDVALTEARLRFSKTEFELDGERGSAEFVRSAGGRNALDLRIAMRRIDLDSYLQGGLKAFSAAAAQGAGSALAVLLPRDNAADLLLDLKADELVLNGVSAADVSLDLASGVTGLDLRSLKIGSVGGAELDATGLILDTSAGPDGSIGVDMKAADPRGMLRLLGLVAGEEDPAWLSELGETKLKSTIAVKPVSGSSRTTVDVTVTSGGVDLAASGQIAETAGHSLVSGSGELKTETSGKLARLAGLSPFGDDTLPGRLVATVANRQGPLFDADLQLELYGSRFAYRGAIDPTAPALGLTGKASLRSTDTAPLAAALGLPVPDAPGQVLVLDSTVGSQGGALSLPDLNGRIGEDPVSGGLKLTAGPSLSGNLDTGSLSARQVLALALLERGSGEPGLDSNFATRLPFGLTGEVWITPRELILHDQLTVRDAQIGITAKTGEIAAVMIGKTEAGGDAHIELTSRGEADLRQISGKIILPVDLAKQMRLAGGAAVATGRGDIEVGFGGEGRSPGGVLATLRGSGAYDIKELKLVGLSPEAFVSRIGAAKDGAGITAAFDAMRTGELSVAGGKAMGFITIVNGEVAFQPLNFVTAQSKTELKLMGELGLGEIDAGLSVAFAAPLGLPGMSVSYAGPPTALARNEDNTELSTKLGVAIMQQGIDELERLRKEQERLAAEEEKQRKDDEEKLAAYYAQRDELILRRRELKIHGEVRAYEAELLRQRIEAERAANAEISKAELKQRVREIRVMRQLAKLERARPQLETAPPPPPKPRAQKPQPARPKSPQTVGPVILAKPEDAPVVISAPPSASPSQ